MPLHQLDEQASGRPNIPLALQEFLQHDAMLIDRPPQPEFSTGDLHLHFVQMPDIAGSRLSAAQATGDPCGEFGGPSPDHLVGSIDAALQQHLFDLTQDEVEADIEPDSMCDDLWRERWR